MMLSRTFKAMLTALVATVAFVSTSYAQETAAVSETVARVDQVSFERPTVRVIPQLGVSSFGYDGAGTEGDPGVSGGITFEVGDKSRVIETGVIYMSTSAQGVGNFESESLTAGYLALPLMAKFYTSGTSDKGLYLKGGMLTAFLASEDSQGRLNPFDLIASAGVGAKLDITRDYKMIIEGTYNYGLMDALDSDEEAYNRGLMVTAGVVFGL